ncbi:hypothetical protein [Bacillus sp. 1P06AnD]|uniref:hypothetical protein n=1 Tax=Bacillus sp. 1P06AnD TaxID=3132208 RepID=UPI0039A2CAD1
MHELLFTMTGPTLKDMIGTFLFAFSVIFLMAFVLNKLARVKKEVFNTHQILITLILAAFMTTGSYLGFIG